MSTHKICFSREIIKISQNYQILLNNYFASLIYMVANNILFIFQRTLLMPGHAICVVGILLIRVTLFLTLTRV